MQELHSHNDRPFMDEVVAATGSFDVLFEAALASGQQIDAVPVAGTALILPEYKEPVGVTPYQPALTIAKSKVVIPEAEQNVVDLSIQTLGSMEHTFSFCLENGVSITEGTVSGKNYKVPIGDFTPEVVAYFEELGIRITTGNTEPLQGYFVDGYIKVGYLKEV